MATCVICSNTFEAKRADALTCSPACRMKASRMEKMATNVSAPVLVPFNTSPPAPEKEKKANLDELGTLRDGQTQEEYIANIPERGYLPDGSKCTHPVEEHYYSRCLKCMEVVPMVTRVRKPLLKGKK